VTLHPDRFAYVVRTDPRDPDIEVLVAHIRATQGAVALSIDLPETHDATPFEHGAYDQILATAEAHAVPIVAWFPGRSELLAPALDRFPRLQVILSHCGLSRADIDHAASFERVLRLARYPGLAIKWCHVPAYLSHVAYPFRDVMPYLRRAIDAFGPQRIMWASDHTESKVHHTWAQALYYLLDSDEMTEVEKEWILGRCAGTLLNLPRHTARATLSAPEATHGRQTQPGASRW
jgi:predicted TIM-barrel fold metal-dependent hydrolase